MTSIEYKIREILNSSNKIVWVLGGDNVQLEELDVDLATQKLLELFEELNEASKNLEDSPWETGIRRKAGAFDENDE